MDFNTFEKKILDILNNLDSVNLSNKLKAEAIRFELENLLTNQSNSSKVEVYNTSQTSH